VRLAAAALLPAFLAAGLAGCASAPVPLPIAPPPMAPPAAAVPRPLELAGRQEQGGLMRGRLPAGATELTLDGKPVKTSADGAFLIGFSRDSSSEAVLAWRNADGSAASRRLAVAPRPWQIESLPGLPLRPVPDAEYERRRPAELARIGAARAVPSDLMDWAEPFRRPAEGRVSGLFGSQRIYAGTPSAFHAGVDYAAPAGAPVLAPVGGIVRLAEGPFTLEGNLVLLDHGFGLVSAFLHLSRIDVREGQVLKAGDAIGSIGATGRVTGPHLHWGITWSGVRLDPDRLLAE